MILKRQLCVAALAASIALSALAQGDFYEIRYQRGVAEFNQGNYARAADYFRVAAFGHVDSIPQYEMAQIYIAVASQHLGRIDEARLAAVKISLAESIQASYTTLQIAVNVRAAFETLLPTLLPPDQILRVPAFARFAKQQGQPSAQPTNPQPTVPQPQPQPPPRPIQPQPSPPQPQPTANDGALALDRLNAGDEAGARIYADRALALDYTNADAHTALARIALAHQRWNEAVAHLEIVRTRRRLTNDENASYFIALVNSGRIADALGVRKLLPAAVLNRSDVTAALRRIEPSSAETPSDPPSPRTQPTSTRSPSVFFVSPPPSTAQPMSAAMSPSPTIGSQVAAAETVFAGGNVVGARNEFRRLAALSTLQRNDRLEIARGLGQTALFGESSALYRKAYPLQRGEEIHMFYEAINRYELGDYGLAKQLIEAALPGLPQTPEVLHYRDQIEGHR